MFPSSRAEGEAPSSVQDANQVYEYFGDTSNYYAGPGTDLIELIGDDSGDLAETLRASCTKLDNGGATWKDTADLKWVNGPTVDPNFTDEPAAWHGNSGGWETSRLDLSDFTGKQLKFRWTEHGKDFADLIPANWWLDNATVYTCSK